MANLDSCFHTARAELRICQLLEKGLADEAFEEEIRAELRRHCDSMGVAVACASILPRVCAYDMDSFEGLKRAHVELKKKLNR